jgi:hypothetical protein
MELYYDHKMRGLLVEVKAGELLEMATKLCKEAGEEDLLAQPIRHVTYTLPRAEEQDKKRPIFGFILTGISTIEDS